MVDGKSSSALVPLSSSRLLEESRVIANSRFNDSASARLEADDEDTIERWFAPGEDERAAAALLKRIATIKRAIIRPRRRPEGCR